MIVLLVLYGFTVCFWMGFVTAGSDGDRALPLLLSLMWPVIILFVAGQMFAERVRQDEHGWRIFATAAKGAQWRPIVMWGRNHEGKYCRGFAYIRAPKQDEPDPEPRRSMADDIHPVERSDA